jgi:hypothetical protein
MGLTWRDLASSVTVLVMIVAYAALMYGTSFPLLTSAWAASAVELVLGALCAVVAAADLHLRPLPRTGVIFRRITTVFGAVALLAGLAGLIADNKHFVEIVVVSTGFLWLTAFIWHVVAIGSEK